jgi:hypothetical protein
VRWGEYGPTGLTAAARYLGYLERALPRAHFNPVRCEHWQTLFESRTAVSPPWSTQSRTVHLWNEMMQRTPGFDKNGRYPADSPFEELCRRYL